MAETFFGPWRIVNEELSGEPWWGFVISGSDNADGEYSVVQLDPTGVVVSGQQWTIELHLPGQVEYVRTTQFVAPDGLTVRLVIPFLTLLCISMDREINPIQTPNPFDFTIPEG